MAAMAALLAGCAAASANTVCGRVVDELGFTPEFSGPSLTNPEEEISVEDFRGRVLVVNVWGSWCGPCRKEQPELQSTWETLSAATTEIAFLGVDVRDNRAAGLAFREEFGVTYPSIFDEDNSVAAALGASAVPMTAALDRDGVLVYRAVGQVTGSFVGCLADRVLHPPEES